MLTIECFFVHIIYQLKQINRKKNKTYCTNIMMSSTEYDNPQTVAVASNDIEEGKKEPCQSTLKIFDDLKAEVTAPAVAIPLASNQDGPTGEIVCCCDTRQVVKNQLKKFSNN